MIVCILDAHEGSIKRYESRVKTHVARADQPLTFTAEFVEDFRSNPPEDFQLYDRDPPPISPISARKAA